MVVQDLEDWTVRKPASPTMYWVPHVKGRNYFSQLRTRLYHYTILSHPRSWNHNSPITKRSNMAFIACFVIISNLNLFFSHFFLFLPPYYSLITFWEVIWSDTSEKVMCIFAKSFTTNFSISTSNTKKVYKILLGQF